MSAVATSTALFVVDETTWVVNVLDPPFSYHTTLLSFSEAEKTSASPSPSMSRACAAHTPSAVVESILS